MYLEKHVIREGVDICVYMLVNVSPENEGTYL